MNHLPKRDKSRQKRDRFYPQITTAQIGLTTQERHSQEKKKERFCLQIKTVQIGLTTQKTEPGEKKGKFCFQITIA